MTREMNKTDWDCLYYWKKTGAMFIGTDEELRDLCSDCGHQHAWTDDEGRFSSFLCMIDWNKCDKKCNKHNPKLNEDIAEFVNELNARLG